METTARSGNLVKAMQNWMGPWDRPYLTIYGQCRRHFCRREIRGSLWQCGNSFLSMALSWGTRGWWGCYNNTLGRVCGIHSDQNTTTHENWQGLKPISNLPPNQDHFALWESMQPLPLNHDGCMVSKILPQRLQGVSEWAKCSTMAVEWAWVK